MSDKKKVFITGASAGFGFDAAKALAAEGHTVYATMRDPSGRNKEKASALSAFARKGGYTIRVLDVDVTDDASVRNGVKTAIESGGVDVVINNAGFGSWGIDEGFTVEQAQQLFDVNFFGVLRVNRAVVPHFRDAGEGKIIYISSGLGRIVFPFMAVYGASKFAIEGFAESTNIELSPLGIETTIIQPGAYGTTFLANAMQPASDVSGIYGPTATMFEQFGGGFEERAKAGELGNPEEVVTALVEEVEREKGRSPLRRCIGQDVQEPVSAINATCDQVQDHLLSAFGLK